MNINIMLYVSGLLTGIILGIPVTLGILHYMFGTKSKKPSSKKTKDKKSNKDKYEELVFKRLERVREISSQQGTLFMAASEPSKNAMHSKHQNKIINDIKILEKEKYELLTAILNDGYDPVVTMQDPHTNEVRQEKLSHFMNELPEDVIKENTTPTYEEKKSKFKVYSNDDFDNEDDDDDNHTVH